MDLAAFCNCGERLMDVRFAARFFLKALPESSWVARDPGDLSGRLRGPCTWVGGLLGGGLKVDVSG
jgi:hypothetical protein